MAAALQRDGMSVDIVHLHSVFLWPTLVAARWAASSGRPYILTPRGMLAAELIARRSRWAKRAWIALFERSTIARAAAVHLTSNGELADFTAMGFQARRVEVIPNGVDPPPFPDASEAHVSIRKPYVLFIGRVSWKKGLDRLIPAMATVPAAELLIVGNDDEGYRSTLEAIGKRHCVSDRVHFLGEVDGSEKWSLIRRAALLALTSYNESFGLVVLEAMAAGCPVLVTPEVGLATEVLASGAGVVVPGDPDAIGSAIRGLLQRPEERRRMGEQGSYAANSKYSWASIADRIESLYAQSIDDACAARQ
jgi:glycosyltransferase involved in cell wall biosynthesis